MIVIIRLERGIPSKCESSARADYVPALCTHRPSLLPIEWSGENVGSGWLNLRIRSLAKVVQTLLFRGRRSRNKVSVGEPAEGSLTWFLFLPSQNSKKIQKTLLVFFPEPVKCWCGFSRTKFIIFCLRKTLQFSLIIHKNKNHFLNKNKLFFPLVKEKERKN